MPITVTCTCGKQTQVPDSTAGKRGKCTACGAVIRVPDLVASHAAGDRRGPGSAAKAPPTRGEPTAAKTPWLPIDLESPRGAALPPEPWYYRAIPRYALAVMAIGFLQFLLTTIWNTLTLVQNLDNSVGPTVGLFESLAPFLASLALLLLALLLAAPLLLGVDAARHLRALRYHAEARDR